MQIPQAKSRPRNDVCPAGLHRARLDSVAEIERNAFKLHWTVMPAGSRRRYRMDQQVDARGLADVAVDLGLAGQQLDPVDIAGECRAQVRTFGGQRSARIMDTQPLEG